jgi:hypothetical protein
MTYKSAYKFQNKVILCSILIFNMKRVNISKLFVTDLSSLRMLQELKTKTFVEMCTLYDSREICKQDLSIIHELCIANIGSQGSEGIMCNLREGAGNLKYIKFVVRNNGMLLDKI